MYDQPIDPDQIIYAIYLIKSDGSLYPETWYESEDEANNRASSKVKLSGSPHAVKPIRYGEFIQELRVYH